MQMAENFILKGEEKVLFKLRSLYSSFGYRPYRMSRFEEYDLYARNKDFLVSGNIITFTDTDGKLMALKPDVTLSIVRSVRDEKGAVSRIYYGENVYRVSDRSGTFREIMQAGLECIGDVGLLEITEVVRLAQLSLKAISDSTILTISHMGVVESILSPLPEVLRAEAIKALAARNVSALNVLSKDNAEYAETLQKAAELAMMMGPSSQILDKLQGMGADEKSVKELRSVVSMLEPKSTRIDFSLLDGMKYYNGITFRGFVEGVPVPVISGGQYDKLMRRMKKSSSAIGFAVYMDALERLLEETQEFDVDTVLLYEEGDKVEDVLSEAKALRESGRSVVTLKSLPTKLRYRDVLRVGGGKDA